MSLDEQLARVARNDCTAYAANTGAWCTKAATHVQSDEPAVRRHDYGTNKERRTDA